MTAANVILFSTRPTARPIDPLFSEELRYTSQVAIGFDALADGSVIAFRRAGSQIGFIPCPDVGTACTILLLLHHEIRLSRKAGDLGWHDGFHTGAVEDELDDIFLHYAPHLRILQENGMSAFDEAFDRDDHLERVTDGLEEVQEGI